MTRTTTIEPAGTSTGVLTPVRETVGVQDHPLGEANAGSPSSPFVEVNPPPSEVEVEVEAPAPGPSTRSQTRVVVEDVLSVEGTLERDAEDEIEETQGEDLLDGASLSEQDEALSDGHSSYGDDSQFVGPPNLQELVRLGQQHCRIPCRMKNKDGVQVSSVCGKKSKDCKLHATKRLGAKSHQYAIGSYPWVSVSRGFTGHGLANGVVYSDDQIEKCKAEEAEEMEKLVQTMNESAEDADEMEELARDLRVHFKASEAQPEKTSTPAKGSTDDLRKALAAKTAGPTKKKGPLPPELWFGMVTPKRGNKWITRDAVEANEAAAKKGCRIAQVFHTLKEAEAWLEGDEDEDAKLPALLPHRKTVYDSDDDSDDDSVRDVDVKARRRKKRRAQKARKRQAANGKASPGRTSEKSRRSSSKGGRKKPQKAGRHSSSKRRGHKGDVSSDPSSSSSSDSDSDSDFDESDESSSTSTSTGDDSSVFSDSSSVSSNKRRRSSRNKRSKKEKARKAKSKNKNKEENYHKYQHDDPSTGDPQRVYGVSINGLDIDQKVAPNSMRRSDRSSMYAAAVDVSSLPGGWNPNKGGSEELHQESQKIAQLTSTILASTNKIKSMEVQDTSWNSTLRHGLGKISSKKRESSVQATRKSNPTLPLPASLLRVLHP
jgi:hypothetical protein